MTDENWPAGWGFPGSATKAHYFLDGEFISLCNKWLWTGKRREPNSAVDAEVAVHCVVCRRKLQAIQ